MAYDADLADRIRELSAPMPASTRSGMFGGLAFLINGNMSVAASGGGGLLVRVPPERTDELLTVSTSNRWSWRAADARLAAGLHDGVKSKRQLQSWVAAASTAPRACQPK